MTPTVSRRARRRSGSQGYPTVTNYVLFAHKWAEFRSSSENKNMYIFSVCIVCRLLTIDHFIFFQHSPYAANDDFVRENRILKHKYAQMKNIASKERTDKIYFKERCVQLERNMLTMQPHQAHLLSGPSFIPQMHAPTHSQLLPTIGQASTVEKSSIESIEVPEYLKQ